MARKPRPASQDAESVDSQPAEVRAREPESTETLAFYPPEDGSLPPLAEVLPDPQPDVEPVGGATEPPHHTPESLASEFAARWENVACGDVLTVLTLAIAVCRIAAIVVPLFAGRGIARDFHTRILLRSVSRHWPNRSAEFHCAFADELTEFVYALPDNGVSREEVTLMLSEMQANGTRQCDHG